MMINRDQQRARVYAWIRALPEWTDTIRARAGLPQFTDSALPRIAMVDCESSAHHVWADWIPEHEPPPDVVGAPDNKQRAWGGRELIELPPWGRTPLIVMHEIAHAIHQYHDASRYFEWHDPTWALLFLDLLSEYTNVNVMRARRIARAHRVTIADPFDRIHPLGRMRRR